VHGITRVRPHASRERIHTYFDRIRLRFRRPLPLRELRAVVRLQHFEHRVEVFQPGREALELMATLPDDVSISYLEPAFDFIVRPNADVSGAIDMLRSSVLLPHRTAEAQAWGDLGLTTRRPIPDRQRAGRWLCAYADRPSKICGSPCVHVESRVEGSRQVRRLGIVHPRDLLGFNHLEHFASIRLYRLDRERLGRYHTNSRTGSRRRKPRLDSLGNNRDAMQGELLYRIFGTDADGTSRSLHRSCKIMSSDADPTSSPTLYTMKMWLRDSCRCKSLFWLHYTHFFMLLKPIRENLPSETTNSEQN
jgi:hypothetical protein